MDHTCQIAASFPTDFLAHRCHIRPTSSPPQTPYTLILVLRKKAHIESIALVLQGGLSPLSAFPNTHVARLQRCTRSSPEQSSSGPSSLADLVCWKVSPSTKEDYHSRQARIYQYVILQQRCRDLKVLEMHRHMALFPAARTTALERTLLAQEERVPEVHTTQTKEINLYFALLGWCDSVSTQR